MRLCMRFDRARRTPPASAASVKYAERVPGSAKILALDRGEGLRGCDDAVAVQPGTRGRIVTELRIPELPGELDDQGLELRIARAVASLRARGEGAGIPPEHRGRISTRFYRPDPSRGRDNGGYGLGLTLTKAYMALLGGALYYRTLEPTGSEFTLRLPQAIAASANSGPVADVI